jgi:hypothetical protein
VQRLLERVAALDLPPNFLDEIVDALGGPAAVRTPTPETPVVVLRTLLKRD